MGEEKENKKKKTKKCKKPVGKAIFIIPSLIIFLKVFSQTRKAGEQGWENQPSRRNESTINRRKTVAEERYRGGVQKTQR